MRGKKNGNSMSEYWDRLSSEKKNHLQIVVGGELGWASKYRGWSIEQWKEVGRTVFGVEVCGLEIVNERNLSNGWDLPVILGWRKE